MRVLRILGFVAIAVAAVVVVVNGAPEKPQLDVRDLVETALDDEEVNAIRASSAPQQQVVNGWVARDLLSAIALAEGEQLTRASDHRPVWLLLLGVLALCWNGVTTVAARGATREAPAMPDGRAETPDPTV